MTVFEFFCSKTIYFSTILTSRSFGKHGGLARLRHLDLSGCINITSDGVESLVEACPSLDLKQLAYCDNITTKYDNVADGCQNQGCLNRVCCRTGYD